jgi:hypothetical protein
MKTRGDDLEKEIQENMEKLTTKGETEVTKGEDTATRPIIFRLTPDQFREAMRTHAIAEAVPADGALEPRPGGSLERAECLGENASQREGDVNMSDNLKKAV